jgi:hypothetical protein
MSAGAFAVLALGPKNDTRRRNLREGLPPGATNRLRGRQKAQDALPGSAPRRADIINTNNKPAVKTRFGDMVSGITKNVTTDVTIGGVKYTPLTLAAVFTQATASIEEADANHKQWLDSVGRMNAAVAAADATYKLVRNYLFGLYGTSDKSRLGDFGVAAPKPRTKKSASTKAAAAIKAAATRTKRHTMGPKQKKQVKSNVQVRIAAVPASEPEALPAPAPATKTGG